MQRELGTFFPHISQTRNLCRGEGRVGDPSVQRWYLQPAVLVTCACCWGEWFMNSTKRTGVFILMLFVSPNAPLASSTAVIRRGWLALSSFCNITQIALQLYTKNAAIKTLLQRKMCHCFFGTNYWCCPLFRNCLNAPKKGKEEDNGNIAQRLQSFPPFSWFGDQDGDVVGRMNRRWDQKEQRKFRNNSRPLGLITLSVEDFEVTEMSPHAMCSYLRSSCLQPSVFIIRRLHE